MTQKKVRRHAGGVLIAIEDVTAFVREQALNATPPYRDLMTPREAVYPVADEAVAKRLGVENSAVSG